MAYPRYNILIAATSGSMRTVLSIALSQHEQFQVAGTAKEHRELLTKALALVPDAIVLEACLPDIHNFSTLKRLVRFNGSKCIVVGTAKQIKQVAPSFTPDVFIEIQQEPTRAELNVLGSALLGHISVLLGIAGAPADLYRLNGATATVPQADLPSALIVIGGSTGGIPVIEALLRPLTPEALGRQAIVVAQHLPGKFTHTLVKRLNSAFGLKIEIGYPGYNIGPGSVTVVPGSAYSEVNRYSSGLYLSVTPADAHDNNCPSIDQLMKSAARAMRRNTVGIILAGMGQDGSQGMEAIAREGGGVWVQQPEECVVAGMPTSAIKAVAGAVVLPLAQLAERLSTSCREAELRQGLSSPYSLQA